MSDPKHQGDAPASAPTSAERTFVIPISCWRPRHGTGIPADTEMYPGGCHDPDWCRGNRSCYWRCVNDGGDHDV